MELARVPNGWLNAERDIVYWPKNSLVSLMDDVDSQFETDWMPQPILKIYETANSIEEAETLLEKHQDIESETERQKRIHKRKTQVSPSNLSALPHKQAYNLMTPSPDIQLVSSRVVKTAAAKKEVVATVTSSALVQQQLDQISTGLGNAYELSMNNQNKIVSQQQPVQQTSDGYQLIMNNQNGMMVSEQKPAQHIQTGYHLALNNQPAQNMMATTAAHETVETNVSDSVQVNLKFIVFFFFFSNLMNVHRFWF